MLFSSRLAWLWLVTMVTWMWSLHFPSVHFLMWTGKTMRATLLLLLQHKQVNTHPLWLHVLVISYSWLTGWCFAKFMIRNKKTRNKIFENMYKKVQHLWCCAGMIETSGDLSVGFLSVAYRSHPHLQLSAELLPWPGHWKKELSRLHRADEGGRAGPCRMCQSNHAGW